MYAEPSARRRTPASIRTGRSSSGFRPSKRLPSALISFISFSMCSMSSIITRLSGGPRPSCLPSRALDQFPDGLREAERLGALSDQADRLRGDRGIPVIPVQPDPTILPDVDLAVREVPAQRDHAPLFRDHPRDLRRGDLDHHPAVQALGLPLLHRELHPLDLVHAQHVAHDHIADLQVASCVAELDAPRGFRRVEGGGIGRVDVDEPMGWPEVRDLADHRVAPQGDVAPVQRDHADEPVSLVPNAQLSREKLPAFAVRARSRFQPGAADRFAWNDHWAKPLSALHWFLSLTRRVEMEAAT